MEGNGLDLGKILKMVTDNPAMLQTALSFAGKLKDSAAAPSKSEQEPQAEATLPILQQPKTNQDSARENERRLLLALRPYLGQARQDKIDFVLKILQLLELAGSLGLGLDTKTKGREPSDV